MAIGTNTFGRGDDFETTDKTDQREGLIERAREFIAHPSIDRHGHVTHSADAEIGYDPADFPDAKPNTDTPADIAADIAEPEPVADVAEPEPVADVPPFATGGIVSPATLTRVGESGPVDTPVAEPEPVAEPDPVAPAAPVTVTPPVPPTPTV